MSFVDDSKLIRAKMAEFSLTPIEWPNGDPVLDKGDINSFVRFEIDSYDETFRGVGVAPVGRRVDGLVSVSVFVKAGTGEKEATTICDEIRNLFRDPGIAGISTTRIETRKVGIDNQGYVQWANEFGFWRWETV